MSEEHEEQTPSMDAVPALDLQSMTPVDVQAAMGEFSEEDKARWKMTLGNIFAGVQANNDARHQAAVVTAQISAFLRTVGLVMSVA